MVTNQGLTQFRGMLLALNCPCSPVVEKYELRPIWVRNDSATFRVHGLHATLFCSLTCPNLVPQDLGWVNGYRRFGTQSHAVLALLAL